tara:strand:+ start:10 stop:879 length:870 start_codon:yes stop_codon:yes gene_type:complete
MPKKSKKSKKSKKLHIKNLKKYDNNNDGLITMKEYLDKEISKGPKEKKTDFFLKYNYQANINVYNYFMLALKNFKKFKILCVPNFLLKWNNKITRTAIVYDIEKKLLYMSQDMVKAVTDCRCNDKARFIFISFLILYHSDDKLTHANIIVIDLHKKTLELFEPHGHSLFNSSITKINNKVIKSILKYLKLNKFKYLSPIHLSPKIGIQINSDSYCGMCITISMMYLHMRILNPDINPQKIVKYFINQDPKKVKIIILKYTKHIQKTLIKNKIKVKKFNKEFLELSELKK